MFPKLDMAVFSKLFFEKSRRFFFKTTLCRHINHPSCVFSLCANNPKPNFGGDNPSRRFPITSKRKIKREMASTAHTVASQISPRKKKRKRAKFSASPSFPALGSTIRQWQTVQFSGFLFLLFSETSNARNLWFCSFLHFGRLCNKAGFSIPFIIFKGKEKGVRGTWHEKEIRRQGGGSSGANGWKIKQTKPTCIVILWLVVLGTHGQGKGEGGGIPPLWGSKTHPLP